MRLISSSIMWYRAISSFGSTSMRPAEAARRELALQIEVDVARYLMIALRINLMNISAVTIFFGQGSSCLEKRQNEEKSEWEQRENHRHLQLQWASS